MVPDRFAPGVSEAGSRQRRELAARKAKDDAFVVGGVVRNTRLWVVGVAADGAASGAERPLTPTTINVGDAFGGGHLDWTPDGSTIAFVRGNADLDD